MPSNHDTSFVASPALSRVAAGNLCSGCAACAALASGRVVMKMTAPGYLRPEQRRTLLPEQEAAIAAVCPGLRVRIDAAGRHDDPLWGPLVSVRRGWATDPETRFSGASGGALTALAAWLLDSGTVDGVVQITADPARPMANITVVSETAAQVRAAAGSRYAPSDPLAGLDRLLTRHRDEGTRHAVICKPCDAAALRAWTLRDSDAANAFPIILSFFCGGIPSEAGTDKLLAALGVGHAQLGAFRYRGMGWPGEATAQRTDATKSSMSYHESWGRILSHHVQHRCKICADSSGMAADIACADAWHVGEDGRPKFDEAPGISLIIARTRLGAYLLSGAEAADRIHTAPFELAELAAIQPGQTRRRHAVPARLLGQMATGRPIPRYCGLHLGKMARQAGLRLNLRSFFGMLKRHWIRRRARR